MKAPTIRNPFAAQPLPEQPDIEAAALRSDRFRLEREGDWRRLEQIVRRQKASKSDHEKLEGLAKHLSSMERNSVDAERESVKDKLLLYYKKDLGKRLPALGTLSTN